MNTTFKRTTVAVLLSNALFAGPAGATSMAYQLSYNEYGDVATLQLSAHKTDEAQKAFEQQSSFLTGHDMSYQYNKGGLLNAAYYLDHAVVQSTSYNQSGEFTSRTRQDAHHTEDIVETQSFDNQGRLKTHKVTAAGQVAYQALSFNFDKRGNIKSYVREDAQFEIGGFVYDYDEYGQLESYELTNVAESGSVSYGYDARGNLTGKTVTGFNGLNMTATSAAFDSKNRRQGWTYDGEGRLTADDKYLYFYNRAGRVALVRDINSKQVVQHNMYDDNGYRVRMMANDEVTFYLRDGSGQVIQSITQDDKGNELYRKNYALTGDKHQLTVKQLPDGTTEHEYAINDYMGTGAVHWSDAELKHQLYSPYGEQMNQATARHEAYGYTGHEQDVTELTYMRARYYDAVAGRFNAPDQARDFDYYNPRSVNLYQYVGNNPVNAFDPSGKAGFKFGIGIGKLQAFYESKRRQYSGRKKELGIVQNEVSLKAKASGSLGDLFTFQFSKGKYGIKVLGTGFTYDANKNEAEASVLGASVKSNSNSIEVSAGLVFGVDFKEEKAIENVNSVVGSLEGKGTTIVGQAELKDGKVSGKLNGEDGEIVGAAKAEVTVGVKLTTDNWVSFAHKAGHQRYVERVGTELVPLQNRKKTQD